MICFQLVRFESHSDVSCAGVREPGWHATDVVCTVGANYNQFVRNSKAFRNPRAWVAMVAHMGIEQHASCHLALGYGGLVVPPVAAVWTHLGWRTRMPTAPTLTTCSFEPCNWKSGHRSV